MKLQARPKAAVIGGGIFGCTAALELSKTHDVDLFEKENILLSGATFANHNRHHLGFHYPRSPETAIQCLESRSAFDELYGEAVLDNFPNYYCVGKESRVSPAQYLEFCKSIGLKFVVERPTKDLINPDKIDLCLRASEGVCDFYVLKDLVERHLQSSQNLHVRVGHAVRSGKINQSGTKVLEIQNKDGIEQSQYQLVVSAIYANHNSFCDWFDFEKRSFQFNLQELDIVQLPRGLRLGATIMDGSYPSILPFGNSGFHIMAHVDASQLVRESSFSKTPLMNRLLNIESNWEGIRKISEEYFPMLSEVKYIRSFFVDRVVDASRSATDARTTELVNHGSGCYSIFAAKVITCVSTSRKLSALIRASA